jgi:hypothetical protein
MRGFIAILLGLAAGLVGTPVYAQGQDRVVVTASRIQSEDEYADEFGDLPYVSIKVPADFVMFSVNLESSTKSIDERGRELEQTYTSLIQRAARAQGITMEVGAPGLSIPTETATASEVIVKGRDRSSIPVVLTFATRPGDTFATVRRRAEAFIRDISLNGRVEATAGANQYIGVNDPAKHRVDLLRKVAEDARLLQDIFANAGPAGASPGVSLTGLAGRVKTRPVGPLEIEMFIPYAIVLGAPPQR